MVDNLNYYLMGLGFPLFLNFSVNATHLNLSGCYSRWEDGVFLYVVWAHTIISNVTLRVMKGNPDYMVEYQAQQTGRTATLLEGNTRYISKLSTTYLKEYKMGWKHSCVCCSHLPAFLGCFLFIWPFLFAGALQCSGLKRLQYSQALQSDGD